MPRESLLNFVALVSTEDENAGILARLRALLIREDWIYLLSLLVPVFIYDVALKAVRVATQLDVPGPLGFLDQIRSEMFFNLGYVVLWIGLFAVTRRALTRFPALIFFHLATITVAALTTSAHFYYKTTGSTLDFSVIAFSFSTFGEVQEIIASETTSLHWLLISTLLFYGVAGPAIVTRILGDDWYIPAPSGESALGAGGARPVALSMCFLAVVLGSLSLVPSVTGAGSSFSRDAVANVFVRELVEPPSGKIQVELAAGDLPTDATLKATKKTERRNVVMVVLESTRAESTTPYAQIGTTPFMGELANDSVVAENAYAVVPHTSKALTASICGVTPPLDTDLTESEPDAIPGDCLADLLGEQGYNTAFFQSATENFERRPQLVENFGYEDFYPVNDMDKTGFEEVNYFGYEDDIMLEPSQDWLLENGSEPFFATYLTVTTHHDYTVPERYGEEKYVTGEENEDLNRYLNTIYYQDHFLENLFDQYKEMGLYEDTVFVIVGDHGEGFGEHERYQHDDTIYNEGLRIPLIVHDPRRSEGRRNVEPAVNELDIMPTVADLLNYEVEGGDYNGASILSPPRDRVLMASCFHDDRCLASMEDNKKYIYHYGNKADEFFNLTTDPQERNNIADQQPDKELNERRQDLLVWQATVNKIYEYQLNKPEETTIEETTGITEETTAP
jgi:arylsulfatase A-like enzyme